MVVTDLSWAADIRYGRWVMRRVLWPLFVRSGRTVKILNNMKKKLQSLTTEVKFLEAQCMQNSRNRDAKQKDSDQEEEKLRKMLENKKSLRRWKAGMYRRSRIYIVGLDWSHWECG